MFYNVGPGQTNKAEKHNDNEATKPGQRYKTFLFVTDFEENKLDRLSFARFSVLVLKCSTLCIGSWPYLQTLDQPKNVSGTNTLAYFVLQLVTKKKFCNIDKRS